MEKNLLELKNENSEEVKEYFEFIKDSVADKSYFKDGLDWYFFRYLKPVCDRTLLIFGSIISAFILYVLVGMVRDAFPLVETKAIVVSSVDETRFYPKLIPLKSKKDGYSSDVQTVDQALVKYLLEYYVKERESFDFKDGDLDSVNKKFNRIKNMSSLEEYRAFQLIMSKDNPNSPINFFGQDVTRSVEIDSFSFVFDDDSDDGITTRAKNFILNRIPISAKVYFTTNTKTAKSEVDFDHDTQRFMAKINFYFDGVARDKGGELDFAVKSYELYKIK